LSVAIKEVDGADGDHLPSSSLLAFCISSEGKVVLSLVNDSLLDGVLEANDSFLAFFRGGGSSEGDMTLPRSIVDVSGENVKSISFGCFSSICCVTTVVVDFFLTLGVLSTTTGFETPSPCGCGETTDSLLCFPTPLFFAFAFSHFSKAAGSTTTAPAPGIDVGN
jgi:hypothetical protein